MTRCRGSVGTRLALGYGATGTLPLGIEGGATHGGPMRRLSWRRSRAWLRWSGQSTLRLLMR